MVARARGTDNHSPQSVWTIMVAIFPRDSCWIFKPEVSIENLLVLLYLHKYYHNQLLLYVVPLKINR
jgi:hypothetical protein